jgi:hypothetical protein
MFSSQPRPPLNLPQQGRLLMNQTAPSYKSFPAGEDLGGAIVCPFYINGTPCKAAAKGC